MLQKQQMYHRRSIKKVRATRDQLKIGPIVVVRREHTQQKQTTHKLSPITDGHCKAMSTEALTVTIKSRLDIKRVSRDCIA